VTEPAKKTSGGQQAMGCAVVLVLAAVIFFLFSSGSNSGSGPSSNSGSSSAAREAARRAVEGPYRDTEVMSNCRRVIRDRLIAPSSAKFPGVFSGDFSEPRRNSADGYWVWRTHVDAQNAFGAMLRQRYECVVRDDGTIGLTQLP
jgi:hypothetical protein